MRYSGLALSELSPYPISHDSISRWLNDKCFRPRDLWEIANKHIDSSQPSLLICDDTVGKTKNTHFCDMLSLAKSRGLNPTAVVMDAWYSSLDNLDIPEEGLSVHLRGYGWIFVFKFEAKNGGID
jgi:hypothetical protein